MRSRAAVVEGPGSPLVVEPLEVIQRPAHCLLIRTVASGVCGTDLHVVQGTMETDFPVVLGHEAAGIVQDVGDEAEGFARGDRVVVSAITPCYACEACAAGTPYRCDRSDDIVVTTPFLRENGQPVHAFLGIGSLSEYVIAPAAAAVALPEDVPWPVGALLACAGQTGLGSVFNIARVTKDSSVAVFGCGPVGLCVIMASRVAGADMVIGLDIVEGRLALARSLGATAVVNPSRDNPESAIRDMTGQGCGFAFECVGKTEVMEQAFRSIRPGGTLVVIGAAPDGSSLSIDPRELLLDRRVVGSLAGAVDPRRDYPQWLELYRRGALPLDAMVTTYTIDAVGRAFEEMAAGVVAKPVITFG